MEYYRRITIVPKSELSASYRLEAIICYPEAVQFYYYTLENDCNKESEHEIADTVCVARKFRRLAKPGFNSDVQTEFAREQE